MRRSTYSGMRLHELASQSVLRRAYAALLNNFLHLARRRDAGQQRAPDRKAVWNALLEAGLVLPVPHFSEMSPACRRGNI